MSEAVYTLPPVEPMFGVIFNIWEDTPIFHCRGLGPWTTRCGRKLGANKPSLPLKHCRKIGKPCKGCFNG